MFTVLPEVAAVNDTFIVSALEGCVGISKNLQSLKTFRSCLAQLAEHIETLRAPATGRAPA